MSVFTSRAERRREPSALQFVRILASHAAFGVRWQSEAPTSLSEGSPCSQSGVALRFPPQSTGAARLCRAVFNFLPVEDYGTEWHECAKPDGFASFAI